MTRKDYLIRKAPLYAAAVILAASPALADPGGNGKAKGHGGNAPEIHKEMKNDNHDTTLIRIGDGDRDVLRGYLERDQKSKCPPGLAKKHNGCLPPGQAKKMYQVGHPLADSVTYYPVPRDILEKMYPAPKGYKYVRVDTDVLLISEATKKVIDAVTLLSAVGK